MSANIEIMIENETDEIINDLFESLLSRLWIGLEELMKGSDIKLWLRWFIPFDYDDLLNYKYHKIHLHILLTG